MHDHAAHDHSHGAGHSHAPASYGRAFAVGVALNVVFVLVEVVYGVLADSTALLADAGHNLSDVLGLLAAWTAATLAQRPPSGRFTYGMRSTSILAALFNALLLLAAVGGIAWEAIRRFAEPVSVAGTTVMVVAAIGVAVNGATAALFMKGRRDDINIRGAFLHMAADAGVSAGVILAGLAIVYTGASWIDPAASLAIAALIFWSTWGLLRDSVTMSLDAAPRGLNVEEVAAFLGDRRGVTEVHDLHVWSMSTTEVALTAHLVIPSGHPGDDFLRGLQHELHDRFGIAHPTIQVERAAETCPLAPPHVV